MIEEKDVMVPTRGGERIALRIYRPQGVGRAPALYAASSYRYDNNDAPDTALFPWRETGPIEWYVKRHGYAYVHADVLGTGRSEGEYRFLDRREQEAHYDVIQWIAAQPWSSGRVGGIGQSYYCISQWFAAIQNPPALACIAAYDGMVDVYQYFGYSGGIEKSYLPFWYNGSLRLSNQYPANGSEPRFIPYDAPGEAIRHPLYDEFWRERSPLESLDRIQVPLFSIGVWGKHQLHLAGNILGYQRARGPKKLYITGALNAVAAQAAFSKIDFHEEFLLPFYDQYLKGRETSHAKRPPVEYAVLNGDGTRTAESWPPPGTRPEPLFLSAARSGTLVSLNDGSLAAEANDDGGATSYSYPHESWSLVRGVAVSDEDGRPDPLRTILTFTGAPLDVDLEIAGHPRLTLFVSTTGTDADFIVRLSEQRPGKGASTVVTRGYLRASHRRKHPAYSSEQAPYYDHSVRAPLAPGEIYQIEVPLEPTAYRFRTGSRVRIEIANHDTPLVDGFYAHRYVPTKRGTDTFHHSGRHPSRLTLPVVRAE